MGQMAHAMNGTVSGKTGHWVATACAALLCLHLPAKAQSPVAEARLDSNSILIGQQVRLHLGLSYRVDNGPVAVQWPLITDTLTAMVPVLHDSHVDTVLPDQEHDPFLFRQERTLTITSWDSGYWAIPPFCFVVNGDTVESAPLLLTVNTVPVDIDKGFRDIKEIYLVPFSLKEWLREHWKILLGSWLLAVAMAFLLYRVFIRPRRRKAAAPPAAPLEPLHIRTLLALEALQQKKLCQQERTKEYYSELTDILRGYVQERYGVPAMEQTTDELLAMLRMGSMPRTLQEQFGNLLRLADMVKFAKWKALPVENEQVMSTAIRMVQETAENPTDAPLA